MAIKQVNDKMIIIEDAIFAYAKLAESTPKYQSSDREYAIDVIVDKATAKDWNKRFSKQKAKEFEAAEFAEKFKMPAPFGDDDVFVIKMKKAATKDGVPFDEKYRPKVVLRTATEDVDITVNKLMSNGSKGKVSARVTSNDFGTFAQLQTVFMLEEDFIEYTSSGGGVGSEFGARVTKVEPASKAATEARASKAVPKQEPEGEDDEDLDSPF